VNRGCDTPSACCGVVHFTRFKLHVKFNYLYFFLQFLYFYRSVYRKGRGIFEPEKRYLCRLRSGALIEIAPIVRLRLWDVKLTTYYHLEYGFLVWVMKFLEA